MASCAVRPSHQLSPTNQHDLLLSCVFGAGAASSWEYRTSPFRRRTRSSCWRIRTPSSSSRCTRWAPIPLRLRDRHRRHLRSIDGALAPITRPFRPRARAILTADLPACTARCLAARGRSVPSSPVSRGARRRLPALRRPRKRPQTRAAAAGTLTSLPPFAFPLPPSPSPSAASPSPSPSPSPSKDP